MSTFWAGFVVGGFEKLGYDYAHESRQREAGAKARRGDKPVDGGKAMAIGGATGAGLGALLGSLDSPKKGLAGGLLGGAIGAGLGGLVHLIDAADIEHAKKIMGMEPKARKEYLAHLARSHEIALQNMRDDLRHTRYR